MSRIEKPSSSDWPLFSTLRCNTRNAVYPNVTTVQLHKLLADCQPKARTACIARQRPISLAEFFKNYELLLSADSNPLILH